MRVCVCACEREMCVREMCVCVCLCVNSYALVLIVDYTLVSGIFVFFLVHFSSLFLFCLIACLSFSFIFRVLRSQNTLHHYCSRL